MSRILSGRTDIEARYREDTDKDTDTGTAADMDAERADAMIGIVTISPQAAADAFGTIAAHLRGNCRVQILTLAGLAA